MNSDTQTNGGLPALELEALCKSFDGLKAARDVSMRVMPGDRKAIIGPNGAGKTTLFNLITGIFPATSGKVLLFGQDVTDWLSRRRRGRSVAAGISQHPVPWWQDVLGGAYVFTILYLPTGLMGIPERIRLVLGQPGKKSIARLPRISVSGRTQT